MNDVIEDSDDEDGAARAFAELRDEVTGLRRSIEDLPAVMKGAAPPDYAPSFGAIVKALNETGARLAAIEGHPALKLTPAQHGQALRQAGAGVVNEVAGRLDNGIDDLRRERLRLAEIVVNGLDRQAQKRAMLWALGGGVAVGLVLFPMLAAFAPGGSYLAALATGNADRWQAGVSLIQVGSPERAAGLASATRLVNANSEALNTCAEAAKKAGKDQKCSVVVQATGAAQ